MSQRPVKFGVDAITFQVINARFLGIVQEMLNSLFRTGYSTIVRESNDGSCAIMNRQGQVVAQQVVLPLHMGAFPACMAGILSHYPAAEMEEGDAFLINHPYEGGSPHAPDLAVVTPVFHRGEVIAFCGAIAHKSDLGGPVPGSCSGQAREIFNEGLHLPAVKYCSRFTPSREVEAIIAANSRTPDLVLGDIRGQLGADRLGERRVREAMEKYGRDDVLATFDRLFEVSERRLREEIRHWHDGVYEAERFVDDDGIQVGKQIRVHVAVHKQEDRIVFDFTRSADQTQGPANIRPPLVRAACAYCLIALTDPTVSVNSGLLGVVDLRLREGSVLNPRFPAPVNTYNPTVHATIDAIFDSLSRVVPDRKRADGCGNRSIILGGRSTRTGKGYIQYEIVYGGTGARLGKDGISGCSVNHGNAKIAPVEIIESEFPVRLRRFELIPDSAGAGRYRGGLGILREYENLQEARFSLRSSKHVIPPSGLEGGLPARPGALRINPGTEKEIRLPTRYSDYPLQTGDIFRLETPGGGGLGDPREREAERVLRDVLNGYVSEDKARELYGVALKRVGETLVVDTAATIEIRTSRSG